MTELRRIKIFLFLVLELQVTAVTANSASVLKRAGDDAMLSCQKVVEGQQNCNGTTWLFGGSKSNELLALVTFGQIERETRISVTANCSLIIKNITAEDAGQFECQQYKSGGSNSLVHQSVIDLSVISMTKHVENQTVTLSCSVMKYVSCKHKVKWLFTHQEEEKFKVKPSENECSATVVYLESNSDNSSAMDQLFQCEVTGTHKTVQLFSFGQHSSGAGTATQKPTTEDGNTTKTTTGSTPYIGVGVALVVMVMIVMVVIGWRAKRSEKRRDENAVNADGGVSYASIRHPKTSSGEALVHGDLDTVTYSTVRSHPSSADPIIIGSL